jgi:hypothetical protein
MDSHDSETIPVYALWPAKFGSHWDQTSSSNAKEVFQLGFGDGSSVINFPHSADYTGALLSVLGFIVAACHCVANMQCVSGLPLPLVLQVYAQDGPIGIIKPLPFILGYLVLLKTGDSLCSLLMSWLPTRLSIVVPPWVQSFILFLMVRLLVFPLHTYATRVQIEGSVKVPNLVKKASEFGRMKAAYHGLVFHLLGSAFICIAYSRALDVAPRTSLPTEVLAARNLWAAAVSDVAGNFLRVLSVRQQAEQSYTGGYPVLDQTTKDDTVPNFRTIFAVWSLGLVPRLTARVLEAIFVVHFGQMTR